MAELRELEPALRARGVGALYLYGSHAQGRATPESDIDLLVQFADGQRGRMHEILDATAVVEDRFPGVRISLTTPDRLHDLYRHHIERAAARVF